MSSYDVAIAYRIYPKVALPGVGFPYSEDKLRLAEICLRSLKESLGSLRAKLWVLLDGCPDSYAQLFRKYFDDRDLVLMPLPAIGNLPTFAKQIEILSQQTDSEFVYFAEDDYVYLPNQFSLMLDFMKSGKDVDFISPYDHLDCYTKRIHDRPKWVRVHGGHHWRTAASTCLTFLTTREKLRATAHTFQSYCRRNSDCGLWLNLTKLAIYNPLLFARLAAQEPPFCQNRLEVLAFWLVPEFVRPPLALVGSRARRRHASRHQRHVPECRLDRPHERDCRPHPFGAVRLARFQKSHRRCIKSLRRDVFATHCFGQTRVSKV